MEKYILKQLLEIERELVVGVDKDKAPKTLCLVRELSNELAKKINREDENQMIAEAVKRRN